jgi:hypothetical protein
MTDEHKAFFLSVALGAFESVKEHEKPGSTRYRKLDNALDNCLKAVDLYRPEAWSFEELNKASALLDEINLRIKELFK